MWAFTLCWIVVCVCNMVSDYAVIDAFRIRVSGPWDVIGISKKTEEDALHFQDPKLFESRE